MNLVERFFGELTAFLSEESFASTREMADAIITFPISATGLNRAIHHACEKNVLVYAYSATVTEPCARTVSYITAGFPANTAQWIVNKIGRAHV